MGGYLFGGHSGTQALLSSKGPKEYVKQVQEILMDLAGRNTKFCSHSFGETTVTCFHTCAKKVGKCSLAVHPHGGKQSLEDS